MKTPLKLKQNWEKLKDKNKSDKEVDGDQGTYHKTQQWEAQNEQKQKQDKKAGGMEKLKGFGDGYLYRELKLKLDLD